MFEINFTRDKKEVREAQRLRFEVFNLEMKEGLKSSYERGLDIDDYDPLCEHLIVREPKNKQVVGTYRLLLGSEARSHFGFYSEKEFHLENIKKLRDEMLELGRSCARKDYRDKALIHAMWQAIADYVKRHRVRYLFGCASLHTTYPREVQAFYSMLKQKCYAPDEFRVFPLSERSFPGLDEDMKAEEDPSLFFRLPSLIKGYLRIGALVCGPPALDQEFGTADLFLLLDINRISSDYLRRFGFSQSKVPRAVG